MWFCLREEEFSSFLPSTNTYWGSFEILICLRGTKNCNKPRGHIDVVFTECDQCYPRCMHTVLCKQKAKAPRDSEDKLELGLVGVEGILQIEALWGYANVWKSLGIPERWGVPCPRLQGWITPLNNKRLHGPESDKYQNRHTPWLQMKF